MTEPSPRPHAPEQRATELVVLDGVRVAVHKLPSSGVVTIGRSADNQIQIDHGSVSRHHARLHVGPTLSIEDLGSTNATVIRARGARTEDERTDVVTPVDKGAVKIAPGDAISLGTIMVVVRHSQVEGGMVDRDTVVCDPIMKELHGRIASVAASHVSVLLLGDTGTGKEVLARLIHQGSLPARARGPFVAFSCADLPETLIESELFGHAKHAFTGADKAKAGLLESADGGTVFLDEIGELSLPTQAKLLRALQERQIRRLGETVPRSIDVRFIAATNRDLKARIAAGAFRSDLYFRINAASFTIPPLRARPLDIAPLARMFIARECQSMERASAPSISPEAMAILERYSWPGNVRELRQAMAYAAVFCRGDSLSPDHLPADVVAGATLDLPPSNGPASEPPMTPVTKRSQGSPELTRRERAFADRLIAALHKHAGNQTYAAEELGIARRTVVSWMTKLNLPRPRRARAEDDEGLESLRADRGEP